MPDPVQDLGVPLKDEKRHRRTRPASDRLGFVLLDHCDFGLIVINQDRLISFWNTWMERTTNIKRASVLGLTLTDVFPDLANNRIFDAIETVFNHQLPSVLSPKLNKRPFPLFRRPNDSDKPEEIDHQVTIKPVPDEVGDVFCYIQITDVTSATRRESQLRKATRESRSQRDELTTLNYNKDRLFSIIAHDLKGPFTALLGLTHLLSKNNEIFDKEKTIEYSDAVNRAAQQVYKLLENLLDWSLIQMGRLEFEPAPLEPKVLIEECLDLLSTSAKNKQVEFIVDADASVLVAADAHMTATILRNLIGNAVKFSHRDDKVKITLRNSLDYCEVEISDSGTGMSEERVFSLLNSDTNETTAGTQGEKGTGLGIQLCKEMIAKQGGTFHIESQLGNGSIFKFTLPRY